MTNKYDYIIKKYANEFNLMPNLVKALIWKESDGNTGAYRYEPNFYLTYIKNKPQFIAHNLHDEPRTISASYGLCQLMLTTAYEMGFNDRNGRRFYLLYMPDLNIKLGCKYLRKQINRFKDRIIPPYTTIEEKGLSAYNAGRPIEGNRYTYVDKVIQKSIEFIEDFK